MDLDEVADELYALNPGDFVARRDERVADLRRAGERGLATAVKGLRRPTVAASVVNRLARQRPEEVERLVDLGANMREAQASLAGDELRALGRQRQQLVAALSREAARLAAEARHPVSDAVQREVESTLDAALADPEAGAAARTGRLLRALEHRGLEVNLEGAVAGSLSEAPAPAPPVAARDKKDEEGAQARRGALTAARDEEQSAQNRLQKAQSQLAEAEGTFERSERRAAETGREVERLESQLEGARRSSERAAEEVETARHRCEEAAEQAWRAADEHAAAAEKVRALQADDADRAGGA